MPTRNVNLTSELDRFVTIKIESGRYDSASAVVRAALRSLERDEREYEAKLAALQQAVVAGEASGSAAPKVFKRIEGHVRRRAAKV